MLGKSISQLIDLISPKAYYERESTLQNYIRSQYGIFLTGEKYEKSENFYQKILEESKPYIDERTIALDIGCATGRMVFEYQKLGARKVCGIDTSNSFINFCKLFQKDGYEKIFFDRADSRSHEVKFINGNIAHYLFGENFSFVSCINVVDRVANPRVLIQKIYDVLKLNGILLLVSPYDWALSPAPKKFRIYDMKSLLDTEVWHIEKEVRSIPYVIPLNNTADKEYACHLIVAKKMK